jgi:NAD+ kinase
MVSTATKVPNQLSKIFSFFFNKSTVEIVIQSQFYNLLSDKNLIDAPFEIFESYKDIDSSFDIFISIGGDGTILRAATLVRDSGVPIVGINAGRLGFLATVQKENIGQFLQVLLDKKFTISKRTLLTLSCFPDNEEVNEIYFAINEISVIRKETASMITIEAYLNEEYLNSYWADGLIIATPTGSTGYSMSCGGPIVTPHVQSLVITPIAPHNLNARPLVVTDDTEIKLKVSGRDSQYLVSLDSRSISVNIDTILSVRKASFEINMIEIPNATFLKTLRKKLYWGEDARN